MNAETDNSHPPVIGGGTRPGGGELSSRSLPTKEPRESRLEGRYPMTEMSSNAFCYYPEKAILHTDLPTTDTKDTNFVTH